ncbi:MAG: transporter substrate-binding domain-containing protein [Bacillota bacterium]|nr:transporter substrate-binding domain-containing protein [Bacillota bacterium]
MKKTMLLLMLCLLGLSMLLCGCGSADGESDLAYIQDKGVMIIGITDYEPMNYRDADGEWTGFDTEFAQAVCEKLGITPEFIEISWDNKILELDAKSIDCVWNGMTMTDEVLNAMSCSQPYINNAQVVVMNGDLLADYDTVESLVDLRFAAEAGSSGEKAILENGLDGDYIAVGSQADALLEVASGSSDACVIDITMAAAMTGEGTSYADLAFGIPLTSEEYGIGFRKGSDTAAAVDAIIDELVQEGFIQELGEKYELSGALVINQ